MSRIIDSSECVVVDQEHLRINQLRNFGAALVLSTVAGIGLSPLVNWVHQSSINTEIDSARDAVEAAKIAEKVETAFASGVRQNVGEGCWQVVAGNYAAGKPLQRTSPDRMVYDLLAQPEKPCGTTTTEVDQNLHKVLPAVNNLVSVQEELHDQTKQLESAKAEKTPF